jgi:hypothetical protein
MVVVGSYRRRPFYERCERPAQSKMNRLPDNAHRKRAFHAANCYNAIGVSGLGCLGPFPTATYRSRDLKVTISTIEPSSELLSNCWPSMTLPSITISAIISRAARMASLRAASRSDRCLPRLQQVRCHPAYGKSTLSWDANYARVIGFRENSQLKILLDIGHNDTERPHNAIASSGQAAACTVTDPPLAPGTERPNAHSPVMIMGITR